MYADPSRACCVQCKHFYFEEEQPASSFDVPGAGLALGCRENVWRVTMETTEGRFREHMQSAQWCQAFESSG
ncbi:MAG: hypothetical protein Q8P41_31660 [Pseudomonadota bacterium]|nr:hypothetical protein [Pseudomonadota bacterium]